MEDSILNTVKVLLGIDEDDTVFDKEIIAHINSSFVPLTQNGVGPDTGFRIKDSSDTWDKFSNNAVIVSSVMQYIYLKTKLAFDPPTNSILMTAINNQIAENEWRAITWSKYVK